MKKISKLCICAAMFAFSATAVLADGMVFEPVEMPSISTTSEAAATKAAAKAAKAAEGEEGEERQGKGQEGQEVR